MLTTLWSWVRRGRHLAKKICLDPTVRRFCRGLGWLGCGWILSAASLCHAPQPLAMGLILASPGWQGTLVCLGSAGGYLYFWQAQGLQGVIWAALALAGSLCITQCSLRETPTLISLLGALTVGAAGLGFHLWQLDQIQPWLYGLRIALGAGAGWLFHRVLTRRDPFADWLAAGVVVLALAQIAPLPWLNLGITAGAALAAAGAFPVAAMAGLALDLARITPIPMTAALCLVYLLRLLPWGRSWMIRLLPGAAMGFVIYATGVPEWNTLPAMALGGLLSAVLPAQSPLSHRRGETGIAQVRLEMASGVLARTEALLLEVPEIEVDKEALLLKAAERACGGCPCRKTCRDRERMEALDPQLLQRPLLTPKELGIGCRKSSRFLREVQRSQEQLRALKANRDRQEECRAAVIQQYRFLSSYLQDLADSLPRRGKERPLPYRAQVRVYANRPSADNGDRCAWFPGTEGNYYVLLCDGMGTGLGAVDEARTAVGLLRTMLTAGFPPEYALASLNSLCALRDKAGAVTVDLLQIRLDTGRCVLYKWGAAPSYLLTDLGAEKIGTAGPPPGLSVAGTGETVSRLSLRQGETLVLLSDGAEGEDVLRRWERTAAAGPGELALQLLESREDTDDATVVLVTLRPADPSA